MTDSITVRKLSVFCECCCKICLLLCDICLLCDVEIGEFQGLVGNFIELVDGLAKQVEAEKIKAIGARNHLKSIAKERDAQKQQLKALIAEKKMQLER